jgi:hypothetical protein
MNDSSRKLLSVCLSVLVVMPMFGMGTFMFTGEARAGNVDSTSITCPGGCSGDAGNVAVDAEVTAGNVLDVQIRSGGNSGSLDLSSPGTGATTTTEYEVDITLNDYDPVVASGAGNFQGTWTETDSGGQTVVTLNTQPVAVQWDNDAGPTAINDPTASHWDGTKTAEVEYTMVEFGMFNHGPSDAEGSYINTNSQSRATVSVDKTNNKFKVDAAGPHYKTDGTTVNGGFFKARLNDNIASNIFGVSRTEQYYAEFGTQRSNSPSVTTTGNAVELTWDDFHYSSGTSAAGADTTDPTASTQSDTTVNTGTSVSFDGTGSTDASGISKYEWDWTNDGTYEGSGSTPSHTYSSTGTYTTTLRVTDGNGNTDTDQRTITVNSDSSSSANANIEITDTQLNETDLTVGDAAMTTVDLENTGGKSGDRTVRYKIDDDLQDDEYVNLGSGDETTVRFNTSFDTEGQYDISIGSDTSVGTVTVSKAAQTTPLTAATQDDTTVEEGVTVQFDASQSTADGAITSYEWDWTSDGTYDGSGSTASYTYTDSGTYTVTLRVTDDSGNTDTATRTVTVTAVADDTETATIDTTETSMPTSTTSTSSTTETEAGMETTTAATDTTTATTENPTAGSGPLSPGLTVVAIIIVGLARRRW